MAVIVYSGIMMTILLRNLKQPLNMGIPHEKKDPPIQPRFHEWPPASNRIDRWLSAKVMVMCWNKLSIILNPRAYESMYIYILHHKHELAVENFGLNKLRGYFLFYYSVNT